MGCLSCVCKASAAIELWHVYALLRNACSCDEPATALFLNPDPPHTPQTLEENNAAEEVVSEEAKQQNRAEKKARKAMQKLGMKPVPGIVRVTIKKAKNVSCLPFAYVLSRECMCVVCVCV